jgi:signal transduction histidine kinase
MTRITIKTKIIIFSCALLLAVVFCQIIFSVFLSKSYYTNLKKSQVETLFYDIKRNYSDDQNVIRGITQYAENAYNISVQIFNDNETIYGNLNIGFNLFPFALGSNRDAYSTEPKAAIQKLPELPRIANMPNLPNLPQINTENIVLTGRFEYNGTNRYVRIMTSVESIDASVSALTTVNTIISGFILVLGIVAALVFAGNISKPVRNIQEVAKNVALLNFDVRADERTSTAELRDLSVSINTMADKLNTLISDLRSSNEKLKADVDHQMRLDKMRREFVANVSHELKSPLHLLLMYAENLKSNIENIDKDYYCNTIIEETNRLNEMVESLLDISAIENGLSKMNKERFNFSDFSESIVSKMNLLYKNLSVFISIEKNVFVEGDSRYIEQAIKNYLVNAVSHTQVSGSVSIELKRQDGKAVFSVFNEGIAIEAEDLSQIWESFYKTDKARVRTDENHSGLGLYVVKTIIEAHNGDYGVINMENGVKFWFSITITSNLPDEI